MPQVIAHWVQRFATRLIQLRPDRQPLDAVKDAVSTFSEACDLTPEQAAEIHAERALAGAPPRQREHQAE